MSGHYELICSQICQKLGWKFKEVVDGVIILEGDTFVSLSDCAISLLAKVKEQEELIGELKTDKTYLLKTNERMKNTIKEFRLGGINVVQKPNEALGPFKEATRDA